MKQETESPVPAVPNEHRPIVSIGWLLAADERDPAVLRMYGDARDLVLDSLQRQFPQFEWQCRFVQRRKFLARGEIDPLPLLELGLREKLYRSWDYVLVVMPNELQPYQQLEQRGLPSSALEAAVLSSASLADEYERPAEALAGLALYLLGHLWGLSRSDSGVMAQDTYSPDPQLSDFSEAQQGKIIERLEEVADARLEEQPTSWSGPGFVVQAFAADPRGILTDTLGYAPWRLPFRMRRLTSAAAVSLTVLYLTAETWELGVNFGNLPLLFATIGSMIGATGFLFVGQQLNRIAPRGLRREQITRTLIVISLTLFLGMISLWLMLFALTMGVSWLFPSSVLNVWTGDTPLDIAAALRYSAFMATLGVIAGALGGNFEEEQVFKSGLLYDEAE